MSLVVNNTPSDELGELIALTQIYLHTDYSPRDFLTCSPEFFSSSATRPIKEEQKSIPPKSIRKPPPRLQEEKAVIATHSMNNRVAPPLPSLNLTKKGSLPTFDFSDLRAIAAKVAPDIQIPPSLPSDARAKEMQNRWKKEHERTDALFLSLKEPQEHFGFFIKIAVALQQRGVHARVVDPTMAEELTKLPSPKVVVASRQVFSRFPELHDHFLTHTKLLPLSSVGDFLANPVKKRELWQELRTLLHFS